VAFLRAVANPSSPTEVEVKAELARAGYRVGRNLTLLGAEADEVYPSPEAAEGAVRSWVRRDVKLIFAFSTSGAAAAHEAAPEVPILFLSNDPTVGGLVTDEARPDRNMSGLSFRVPADRTLDVAIRALPGVRRVGLAYPTGDPAAVPNRDAFAAAAAELGVEFVTEEFTGEDDLTRAVGVLVEGHGVQALLQSTSPTATRAMGALERAAAAHGLPVIANIDLARFAVVVLYPDGAELGRQLARQALLVLQGTPVNEIPVENPRRFTLVLDQVRATALGFEIPDDVAREADVVRR
jgi:putative ABC transport system substrate-binding protein